MFHADEGAAQIDVENAVPLVEFYLSDRRRFVLDAGVVKGHVEPAKCLDSARDRRLDLLRFRYVAGDDHHFATRVPDCSSGVVQRVLSTIKDDDASAFGGERSGGSAPYAAGRAGDEGNLTGEAMGV